MTTLLAVRPTHEDGLQRGDQSRSAGTSAHCQRARSLPYNKLWVASQQSWLGTGSQSGGVMTRSRKKTPIVSVTAAESEKDDKLLAHRRERKRVRDVLQVEADPDVLPHSHDVSDPWVMAKDGKVYVGDSLPDKQRRK